MVKNFQDPNKKKNNDDLWDDFDNDWSDMEEDDGFFYNNGDWEDIDEEQDN